jgi:hypothetical protein
MSVAAADSGTPGVPAALEWRHQPWRDAPLRAATALIASAALGLLALRVAPVPLAGWALAVALLALAGPAFLPAACRVDSTGVARRIGLGWERREWEAIRRAKLGPVGLYVSSRSRGGPLEPFRGLLLPLPRIADPSLLASLEAELRAHGH